MDDPVIALVQQIETEKQGLARAEGDAVDRVLRLARAFVELKRVARPARWGKELKALGCHPRVVSRYLKIGASWLAQTRTQESEMPAGLPYDLVKLEWM